MHQVQGVEVRCHGVRNLFQTMREDRPAHICVEIDNNHAIITAAIERGEPAWAEQMLRSQEVMVGLITHEQFQHYMQQALTH